MVAKDYAVTKCWMRHVVYPKSIEWKVYANALINVGGEKQWEWQDKLWTFLIFHAIHALVLWLRCYIKKYSSNKKNIVIKSTHVT